MPVEQGQVLEFRSFPDGYLHPRLLWHSDGSNSLFFFALYQKGRGDGLVSFCTTVKRKENTNIEGQFQCALWRWCHALLSFMLPIPVVRVCQTTDLESV